MTGLATLDNSGDRLRTVIVKLRRPRERDALLAAVSKFYRSNKNSDKFSSHLGIAGSRSPIFVTEHLSKERKWATNLSESEMDVYLLGNLRNVVEFCLLIIETV